LRNNLFHIWWARFRCWYLNWRYLLVSGLMLAVILGGGLCLLLGSETRKVPLLLADDACSLAEGNDWRQMLKPAELGSWLHDEAFSRLPVATEFEGATANGRRVKVFTTLDPEIQTTLIKLLRRYHPQLGAGVVIDLASGAVEAMASYRHRDEGGKILPREYGNLCLHSPFPAASLFKIVTAYGVLCRKGIDRHTTFPLVGRRHTLYRYQLGLGKSRYRYRPVAVSLEEAFARSVNPIFGKFGIDYFPPPKLMALGEKFAFNRDLGFDLPLERSLLVTPASDFERAETACGFIKSTRISPVHAALLAGAPLLGTALKQPYVVDRVIDAQGVELYSHRPEPAVLQLANAGACRELTAMMRATVRYGTAKKSFRHLKRRRIYRQWDLGGKTGSLDMPGNDHRCEWFAGFARDRKQGCRYAVAVVLVHGEKRTISSSYIAAELMAAELRKKR